MENMIPTQAFKDKLQQLQAKRSVTNQLRTHLRHLIMNELQSGPTAKSAPTLTNRSRAIGSLIVEWLQMHDCHYTLTVLSTEIPGFTEFPALVNEDGAKSLRVGIFGSLFRQTNISESSLNTMRMFSVSVPFCRLMELTTF